LLVTSNQPFSEWEQVFANPAMTVAAVDRLVDHSTLIAIKGGELSAPQGEEHSARTGRARKGIHLIGGAGRRREQPCPPLWGRGGRAAPAAVLPYPPWPKNNGGTQAILPIKS
jgi:hypothetical protein